MTSSFHVLSFAGQGLASASDEERHGGLFGLGGVVQFLGLSRLSWGLATSETFGAELLLAAAALLAGVLVAVFEADPKRTPRGRGSLTHSVGLNSRRMYASSSAS